MLVKEDSWRHKEFKRHSKRGGNLLYSNTALGAYTFDQYSRATQALQTIFCKKNNKVNNVCYV